MPGLPQNHHQRKSASFASLSNPRFDRIQTQCALTPAICHLAGLKVRTPIMINWSDLGRKRGLPLLTWAMAHDEVNPSQNRLEEAFIARLLRNLSDAIRPLLLVDRGFGRASLLRWLQEMPRHTGRMVDYVVRLKGNVRIQTPDGYQGLLRNYPLRPNRYVFLPGAQYRSDGAVAVNLVLCWGRGHREALVSGNIAARCQSGGAALSPADAAGAVLSRWQAVFRPGSGNGNHYGAAESFAGGAVISLLFVAAGGAAGVVAVPTAVVFVGEAGAAAAGHGMLSGYAGAPA